MTWVNIIVQGILVGGLYALFAAGLSLIFGVMRLVNIAHGDFIVASAYLGWVVVQVTGLHPLASLIIVVPIAMLFGYALQLGIFNRTLGKDVLPPLLVTFGLSVIIQNALLETFTADNRKLFYGTAGRQYRLPATVAVHRRCRCDRRAAISLLQNRAGPRFPCHFG
jgi:branched-chain amino acid transport system permease protein